MNDRRLTICGAVLIFSTLLGAARSDSAEVAAAPMAGGAQGADFAAGVQPLFAKRCYPCHGPDKAEGGLRLNSRKAAISELASGARAVVPSKPDDSELLRRIASSDPADRMPPEGDPLSPEEVSAVRSWIGAGAPWQEHWAFRSPQREIVVPPVKDRSWPRNPIDEFVLAKLEARGLTPNPPAAKGALLRRVYYDLTGLPPSPATIDDFLRDESPDAYERTIDELLASPRYGERYARHWLDLVRYAETNSFEVDGAKPNAWRYRDYVIRSFNDDKPYDRFVREQLAGDELSPRTNEGVIATGYYRLGPWDVAPPDLLQARYDELDDIVAVTGQVFLGLTVNFARCHDHKIDPISQADYYKLLAFFHELQPYGSRKDEKTFSQSDISPPAVAAKHVELDALKLAVHQQMTPLEQAGIEKMSAEDQRKSEGSGRDGLLKEKLQRHLNEADWQRYRGLAEEFDRLQRVQLPPREMALSTAAFLPEPPDTHILLRGNARSPGAVVEPGFPQLFAAPMPVLPPRQEGAKSSGRRLVLADWLTAPNNMLASRVAVNRVWQQHFGRGIVRSTNNFGQNGDPPSHPEMLDWLAAEFLKHDRRFKPLHKLILMSSTYRMSSQDNVAASTADPRNDLIWRFDMRRLSAEELRDSILAATGKLNLEMYGPSIYPEISADVMAGQSHPGKGWGKSTPEQQCRRSIYVHVKRSLIVPLLADFDFPDTDGSCGVRYNTTQPAQALGMLNGGFLNQQADELSGRLRREAGQETADRVRLALKLAPCRDAEPLEVIGGLQLLEKLQNKHGLSSELALRHFCLMVLNLNEFVFLD